MVTIKRYCTFNDAIRLRRIALFLKEQPEVKSVIVKASCMIVEFRDGIVEKWRYGRPLRWENLRNRVFDIYEPLYPDFDRFVKRQFPYSSLDPDYDKLKTCVCVEHKHFIKLNFVQRALWYHRLAEMMDYHRFTNWCPPKYYEDIINEARKIAERDIKLVNNNMSVSTAVSIQSRRLVFYHPELLNKINVSWDAKTLIYYMRRLVGVKTLNITKHEIIGMMIDMEYDNKMKSGKLGPANSRKAHKIFLLPLKFLLDKVYQNWEVKDHTGSLWLLPLPRLSWGLCQDKEKKIVHIVNDDNQLQNVPPGQHYVFWGKVIDGSVCNFNIVYNFRQSNVERQVSCGIRNG